MAKTNEDVLVTESIKIYAVGTKYKEKPFYCTGITNDKTKVLMTGQESLSEAELKKEELIINPMEHYMIRNNDPLVLLKKGDVYIHNKDYALYNLYLIQPNIAHSKAEVVKGTHDFYMQNFEAEARNEVKLSKSKARASGKVADLSLIDMVNLLYFFGENAGLLSSTVTEARVYKLAEENPEGVLRYYDDFDNNQKVVFIKKLITKGIIRRAEAGGYLMFGKVVLGADENEAAAYVYDNKHESVYIPLKDMLDKS